MGYDRLYPFPENGMITVLEILDSVPTAVRAGFDWDASRMFVVELTDLVAARVLAIAFGNERPLDLDGRPLPLNRVSIDPDERDEAEEMLDQCGAEGQWATVLRIRVNCDAVHEAFAAYSALRASAPAGRGKP